MTWLRTNNQPNWVKLNKNGWNLHAFIVVTLFLLLLWCTTVQRAMPSIYYSNEMSSMYVRTCDVSAFVRLVPCLSIFPCAPAFPFRFALIRHTYQKPFQLSTTSNENWGHTTATDFGFFFFSFPFCHFNLWIQFRLYFHISFVSYSIFHSEPKPYCF